MVQVAECLKDVSVQKMTLRVSWGQAGVPMGRPARGWRGGRVPPKSSSVKGRFGEGLIGRREHQDGHSYVAEQRLSRRAMGPQSNCPHPGVSRSRLPGDASVGSTATHPDNAASVSVRPAPRRRCLGCRGSDTLSLQGARHSFPFLGSHCQSQPIPVPRIPPPCSLPFPGHSPHLAPPAATAHRRHTAVYPMQK